MKIVFFDGLCHLCDGFVQFCLKHQGDEKIYFASLQGETAKKHLSQNDLSSPPDTIIFFQDGVILKKSEAIVQILRHLSGWPFFLSLALFFPNWFMNFFYSLIAKNRYKFFGKRTSCRMPSPNDRGLLLD